MKFTQTIKRDPYCSYNLIIKRIKNNSKVLDVGCSTGDLGKILIERKNCKVYGIEIKKEAAKIAMKKGYKKVIICDLDYVKKLPFPAKFFNYIIFADILEHLKDPSNILKEFQTYLKDEGQIICSIPNICNWYSRLKIFFGIWKYERSGIFDQTHLRFFSVKTAHEFIKNSNLKIKEVEYTGNFPPLTFVKFFKLRYFLAKVWPNMFALQTIIVAKKEV